MSEDRETPAERARRKSRLRWITLGETVAIAAVIISGLGLWNSYMDRRDAQADKVAQAARSDTHRPFYLKATANGDGSQLTLLPVNPDDVIQSQTLIFPPAFGIAAITTTSDARIEADWFADPLKDDRRKRDLPEESQGDERVPVMVQTDYLAGGQALSTRSYYDVGYALEGRFLRGAQVKLRGLSLIGPAPMQKTRVDQRLAGLWDVRAGRVKDGK